MKKIVIYYFSGTGNTELVANMFKDKLSQKECYVKMVPIEDVLNKNLKIEVDHYDLIGIGSPVIGYGAPNLVKEFISFFPKGKGQKVFVFRTAGGVHSINFNASKSIIKSMTRAGYDVLHERVFAISSNWVVRHKDNVVKQLYLATDKKVGFMCNELLRGERRIYKITTALKVRMSFISGIASLIFRFIGKDYKVSKACTQCGFCIRNCPSENIHMRNGNVKFKLNCSCCMRCLYSCPEKAISFKLFKFFRVAGDYNIKKITNQSADCNEVIINEAPPFFNNYIQNDNF